MTAMVDQQGRPVILIVEDEESYQDALNIGLSVEGFVVISATNIVEARELLSTAKPDLVLLDVMLPDGSGIDYCRELHDTTRIPVIMVTARSSEIDVVLGLEIGAADYVTKPYRLRELVARMRAVMRRAPLHDASDDEFEAVEVGEVRLDPARREVTVNGEVITLARKEFELLEQLIVNAGRVLTRERLIDEVWGSDYVGDTKTLDVHIRRLRTKVDVDQSKPSRITAIRGVGYRYESPNRENR